MQGNAVGQSNSQHGRRLQTICLSRSSRSYYRFAPILVPSLSPSFRGFLFQLVPTLPPQLHSLPSSHPRRQRGHYVQLQEAFSRSNSGWRSFDHDPEERLGSIKTRPSRCLVYPSVNSFSRHAREDFAFLLCPFDRAHRTTRRVPSTSLNCDPRLELTDWKRHSSS